MAKDVKDIMAAFETRHDRAILVSKSLVSVGFHVSMLLSFLEKLPDNAEPEKYAKMRNELVDGVNDMIEIVNGFAGDVLDLATYHVENFNEVTKEVKGLMQSLDQIKRMIE